MLINLTRGLLIEYGLSLPPLVLQFEFNPETVSRTRTINIVTGNAPGTRGGYDFTLPNETPRVAQGVTVEPEQFSLEILLDATDRMSDPNLPGHAIAGEFGIEPELDTLRSMVEPKSQGPGGVQMLASLGLGGKKAFQRDEHPSVLLLVWGTHILPVFLKHPPALPGQGDVELSGHRGQQPVLPGGEGAADGGCGHEPGRGALGVLFGLFRGFPVDPEGGEPTIVPRQGLAGP